MRLVKGIKFNRNELSGAFGDIGTDFPLIVAMIIAADLHTTSVFIVFGLMQIFTGIVYKRPLPVQPLKAMATLVIAQQIGGNVLLGAGLSIGIVMLILSQTGLLTHLARLIPKTVIRGIQFGLGIKLSMLATQKYIVSDGMEGYALAFAALAIIVIFIDNKRFPAAIIAIALGIFYALLFKVDATALGKSLGIGLPVFHLPDVNDIAKGFVLLAIPQIPLSLGNSILATKQVSHDLFPDRKELTVKRIGTTYSLMNLVVPFLSGIPCCHGSGGMVGHYVFGGRTGGSVILYGLLYIILGLFFGQNLDAIIKVFPSPVLGVILLFEGLALMLLIKDMVPEKKGLTVAVLTGLVASGIQYGFVIAIVLGTLLYYLPVRFDTFNKLGQKNNKP